MKRLLLITNYFPPCSASATHRCLGLVQHLPAQGWSVAVVAPPVITSEPEDQALLRKIPADARIFHAPYQNRMWSRLIARTGYGPETWLPAAWQQVKAAVMETRPDVVLTTSPPACLHYLGMLAKRRYGVRWAADLRDPWVSNITHYRSSMLYKRVNAKGEAAMMRQADLVVANTPSNQRGLQRAFPHAAHKVVAITNGFDPLAQPIQSAGQRDDGVLTLLHAGEFYAGRDPRALLRVLADLEHTPQPGLPRFRLKLLGRLDGPINLPAAIREYGLECVVDAVGQVTHAQVLTDMAEADILLSVQGQALSTSIPAKLYEYLAFHKPILQLAEPGGDVDWVLETAGTLHRVVSQGDEVGIRRALVGLAEAIVGGNTPASDPARAQTFTRAHTMGRLAAHLDGLLPAEYSDRTEVVLPMREAAERA